VGGGAGNVGVPTGRGPPPLSGIQTVGQSAAGIPPGGPSGQAPTQAPASVQSQAAQGPAPTTTPPVHTPSPQEMGKGHLQGQPHSISQVYIQTQNRGPNQVCPLKIYL